jgi:phosphatidylserine/phosphatidylglycerophosphate/cardiolipin synthase-like enzyme
LSSFKVKAVTGASLVLLFPTVAQASTSPATTVDTILNMPRTYSKHSYELVEKTAARIEAMPKGSTFRHMGYLFDTPEVASALIRAHRRGVNVRVILDRGAKGVQAERLASVVGHDRSQRSFVFYPKASGFSKVATRSVHIKFSQFSNGYVSQVGSANFTESNTFGSSNTTEVYKSAKLYNGLRRYFNLAAQDKSQSGYQKITSESGSVKLYTLPGAPDVVGKALSNVKCSSKTHIRVVMFQFTDAQLSKAKRLWKLAACGVDVNVIWNYSPNRILIGKKVAKTLLKTKGGKRIIDVRNARIGGKIYIHDKWTAIRTASGTKVYAGSKNFNGNSNADVVSVNKASSVYDAYIAHYNDIYAVSSRAEMPVYGPIAAGTDEREWDTDE